MRTGDRGGSFEPCLLFDWLKSTVRISLVSCLEIVNIFPMMGLYHFSWRLPSSKSSRPEEGSFIRFDIFIRSLPLFSI